MVLDPIQQIAVDVSETKERLGRVEVSIVVHAQKAEADIAQVQQALLRHETRFDRLESRFDSRFESLEASMAASLSSMGAKGQETANLAAKLALENFRSSLIEERLTRIEQALFGSGRT